MSKRVYLDWNATAPLRDEARDAVLAAMDVVGNPSSVHAEGRAARAIIERARAQLADLAGCEPPDIVFTSGATEAAAWVLGAVEGVACGAIEHDAVCENANVVLDVQTDGSVAESLGTRSAQQGANSETGIMHPVHGQHYLTDQAQTVGKVPVKFSQLNCRFGLVSGHKLGAPKGVGALLVQSGVDVAAQLKGGGQEMGRRSGTENVIGIAGFGAAAAAAKRDLDDGVWEGVKKLRMILENEVAQAAPNTILVGKDAPRLPNTSCFITPGWKGETQVMAMDLAGFAISSGSACSSGKVKESRVLRAMGYDAVEASSAIRVSLGPATTEEEILGFARIWGQTYRRWKERAA